MISFEEIKKYLLQYLTGTSQSNLFDELKRFPKRIVYVPIFNLEKYCAMLISEKVQAKTIDAHILAIKNQFVSNIFFCLKGAI